MDLWTQWGRGARRGGLCPHTCTVPCKTESRHEVAVNTGRPAWHSVITSLSFNDIYNMCLVFAPQSPSVQHPSLTVKTLASPPRDIQASTPPGAVAGGPGLHTCRGGWPTCASPHGRQGTARLPSCKLEVGRGFSRKVFSGIFHLQTHGCPVAESSTCSAAISYLMPPPPS